MSAPSGHKPVPEWRKLERLIQRIFEKVPGAKVKRDAMVPSKSGVPRKMELWVTYPFVIPISDNFRVPLKIKIAVDCKDHAKPIDISEVGKFLDQMDDVGAHAGIMIASRGFGKGAKSRAKAKSLFLVDAPNDLLMLTKGIELDDFFVCQCCNHDGEEDDHMPGIVQWNYGKLTDHRPAVGGCDRCSAPHVMCPDCAETVGFHEAEFNKWIECPGGCGRLFRSSYDRDDTGTETETIGPMERRVLVEASETKGSLSRASYKRLIAGSKWQYAHGKADPLARLAERGWIEPTSGKEPIRLSDDGLAVAKEELNDIADSMYGW